VSLLKKIVLCLVFLVSIFFLYGCSQEFELVGEWARPNSELCQIPMFASGCDADDENPPSEVLRFYEDKTGMTFTNGFPSGGFSWVQEENQIIITLNHLPDTPIIYVIRGNYLFLELPGGFEVRYIPHE